MASKGWKVWKPEYNGVRMNQQTRGERNNNPGNIDRNETIWLGMSDIQPDSRFITFNDPKWGIRALAKVLLSYYHAHGLNTVSGIINRWAPDVENATDAYVNHVAELLNVAPDQAINLENANILESLVRAIIAHENGRVAYSDEVIQTGVDLALG